MAKHSAISHLDRLFHGAKADAEALQFQQHLAVPALVEGAGGVHGDDDVKACRDACIGWHMRILLRQDKILPRRRQVQPTAPQDDSQSMRLRGYSCVP